VLEVDLQAQHLLLLQEFLVQIQFLQDQQLLHQLVVAVEEVDLLQLHKVKMVDLVVEGVLLKTQIQDQVIMVREIHLLLVLHKEMMEPHQDQGQLQVVVLERVVVELEPQELLIQLQVQRVLVVQV
tara:strand:+ start:206 stop:583 length:378 start_codon:yes stop_codon:yes gene_type:complete